MKRNCLLKVHFFNSQFKFFKLGYQPENKINDEETSEEMFLINPTFESEMTILSLNTQRKFKFRNLLLTILDFP